MIDDSVPWRDDLLRTAERLRRRIDQRQWRQQTNYLVEKDLLVGFYAIRRLIESHKTSSRLGARRIPVRLCPLMDAEPGVFDRWDPWDFFDFESTRQVEIDVRSLLHEFIHSFVLMLHFGDDDKLEGILVGSDRTKRKHLYEVSVHQIIALFDYVGRENVVFGTWLGSTTPVRLSQHDLVEIGAARYVDDDRIWHEYIASFKPEHFSKLSGLSPAELLMVRSVWER